MRYWPLFVLFAMTLSCTHAASPYVGSPLRFEGKNFQLTFKVPGDWVTNQDTTEISDRFCVDYYRPNLDKLRVTAYTSAFTPAQSVEQVVTRIQENKMDHRFSLDYRFSQIAVSIDGSESYIIFYNEWDRVAGIVLFRTVPGLDGVLFGVVLMRAFGEYSDGISFNEITFITAISRSLQVRSIR